MIHFKSYFLLFIIGLAFTYNASCQKLSIPSKITIRNFTKEEMRTCGQKNDIYTGLVKIKSKTTLNGEFPFYFAGMDGSNYVLTIKDKDNKPIEPSLLYNEIEMTYFYNKGKESEKTEKITSDKPIEEIIIDGVRFWLSVKEN
jgi:hypothetical protein